MSKYLEEGLCEHLLPEEQLAVAFGNYLMDKKAVGESDGMVRLKDTYSVSMAEAFMLFSGGAKIRDIFADTYDLFPEDFKVKL